MTALVTNNLPFVAAASNGISTLRELILELAIQGRLLKRERSAPSWQMLKLPEVATYRIGKTPPSKEARYWDDAGIPWVSISDMEHFTVLTETSRGVSKDVASETFKYPPVPAGSLLMSFKLTVGKICVLGVDGYHNEAIISLQPKEGVLRDYLMRVLPSIARAGKTKDALMGATLNSASLAELIIPLPTIEEQVRIVAKVDELMALCDRLEADQADAEAAHAQLVQALLDSLTQATDAADFRASWQRLSEHFHTLFTTVASIDALKQTVLQLAVMGKLAPQDPNDERAQALLQRIDDEKTRHVAGGKARRSNKDFGPVSESDAPFAIPVGWQWTRLGSFVRKLTDGEHISPSKASAGMPLLTAKDVTEAGISIRDTQFVPYEDGLKYRQRCDPENGDILVCSRGTIGRCALVGIDDVFCLMGSVILIKPSTHISSRFLLRHLQTKFAQEWMRGASSATAVSALYLKDVGRCLVPVPPLAEQHRIVAKVDELMALCDQLKTQLAESRQQHAQLAIALVEQAVA